MTKKQAIEYARNQISELSQFGDGWKYSVFMPKMNAWRETHPRNYWQATSNRRRDLIKSAIDALHPDRSSNDYEPGDYAGGKWTDWVL